MKCGDLSNSTHFYESNVIHSSSLYPSVLPCQSNIHMSIHRVYQYPPESVDTNYASLNELNYVFYIKDDLPFDLLHSDTHCMWATHGPWVI